MRTTGETRVLITGASSGIGRELARLLGRRGHRLVLLARRMDRLRELMDEAPGRVEGVAVDLADEAALRAVLPALGPVDVLINNAGYGENVGVLPLPEAEHRRIMQVNYFAALTLTRHCLPMMLERRRGHVINIASIATKFGPGGHGAYAAAKAALVALTQSLWVEHTGSGVHFSYVNPGLIRTEFFDRPSYASLRPTLARRGLPADRAARAIANLIDRPKLELCIPRHYRVVDLIRALSPNLLGAIVRRESKFQHTEST